MSHKSEKETHSDLKGYKTEKQKILKLEKMELQNACIFVRKKMP